MKNFLKTMFPPKWKRSDKSERLEAIREMDPSAIDILNEVALTDEDGDVRLAACSKLEDVKVLRAIASTSVLSIPRRQEVTCLASSVMVPITTAPRRREIAISYARACCVISDGSCIGSGRPTGGRTRKGRSRRSWPPWSRQWRERRQDLLQPSARMVEGGRNQSRRGRP